MRYNTRSVIGFFLAAIGAMALLAGTALPSAGQGIQGSGSDSSGLVLDGPVSNRPASISNGTGPMVMVSSSGSVRASEEFVREIDDPATGDRWMLERNAQHSGGPGRMVLVSRGKALPVRVRASVAPAGRGFEAATPSAATPSTAIPSAMIRSGDHLIVEEHTRLLDAVLEATALGPAGEGGTFRARLAIGGLVVRAVAVAPGRALISPDLGVQP